MLPRRILSNFSLFHPSLVALIAARTKPAMQTKQKHSECFGLTGLFLCSGNTAAMRRVYAFAAGFSGKSVRYRATWIFCAFGALQYTSDQSSGFIPFPSILSTAGSVPRLRAGCNL